MDVMAEQSWQEQESVDSHPEQKQETPERTLGKV